MTSSPLLLSIVVPIWTRKPSRVARLLRGLAKQNAPKEIYEVIAVENPRPSLAMENFELSRLRWLTCSREGVNSARNMGAAAANGEWIYFVDDDCSIDDPDHVSKAIDITRRLEPTHVFGGPYLSTANRSVYSRAYDFLQGRWIREGAHPDHGWIHFFGGNLILHRSVFTRFQFDDEIVFGGSETELLMRLFRNGFRGIYNGNFAISHHHELDRGEFIRKGFMQGRGSQLLAERGLYIAPVRRSYWRQDKAADLDSTVYVYENAFRAGIDWQREGKPLPSRWRMEWAISMRAIFE